MKDFLNHIRIGAQSVPLQKRLLRTVLLFLLGISLGAFFKFLDTVPDNELPFLLEYLDIRNFLGRFAVWAVIALCIAVYSSAPLPAAVDVFVFFTGMVGRYYLYSKLFAGFFREAMRSFGRDSPLPPLLWHFYAGMPGEKAESPSSSRQPSRLCCLICRLSMGGATSNPVLS